MGAVAVVTLRGAFRTKPSDLAVISIEKGMGFIGMAVAALIHHRQTETLGIGPRDRMRCMTILTGRQLLVSIGIAGPMHARAECFFDTVVAYAACLGNM